MCNIYNRTNNEPIVYRGVETAFVLRRSDLPELPSTTTGWDDIKVVRFDLNIYHSFLKSIPPSSQSLSQYDLFLWNLIV
jgi:hypothetical protein